MWTVPWWSTPWTWPANTETKKARVFTQAFEIMARPIGFEPMTFGFGEHNSTKFLEAERCAIYVGLFGCTDSSLFPKYPSTLSLARSTPFFGTERPGTWCLYLPRYT